MISRDELYRLAAESQVRVETVERDYILGWLLIGVSQATAIRDHWVFKGGTALRKAYFPTYRFSEDLDFTLLPGGPPYEIEEQVDAVCHWIEQQAGVTLRMAVHKQTRQVPGEEAYRLRVEYIGPQGWRSGPQPRVTLDLTLYEHLVLTPSARPIHHPYSDRPAEPAVVLTYRLEEMLAEKLRALLRRCYPRDLYDAWFLLRFQGEHLDRAAFQQALVEKCRHKGYAYSSVDDFLQPVRRVGFRQAWRTSLQHLVPDVPDFETVIVETGELLPGWIPTGGTDGLKL